MTGIERVTNLYPISLTDLQIGAVAKIHPDFSSPDILEDTVDLALRLQPDDLTPTGHRTVALPHASQVNDRIIAKGYFPSPVGIYGPRANDELRHSLNFYSSEGDYAGKATEDDLCYEHEVLNALRRKNHELVANPNSPIWQLLGAGITGNEIQIWRENDKKTRKHMIVFRRFPYTNWRVADEFVLDNKTRAETELNRLQTIWNVSDRKGVYLKAIGRLSKANGYLHNAGVIHGNLYWSWFDKGLQRKYGRPNTHNVGFDGSVGDFEKRDTSYNPDSTHIDVREALGSFSSYLLLISHMNNEYFADREFVSNAVDSFRKNLPKTLLRKLRQSPDSKQVIHDYEQRLALSRDGKKTRNGMEYFDDKFFILNGPEIINTLQHTITG